MKKIAIFLLLFQILLAKELQVVFGDSLPPYVIPKKSGIELDILKKALNFKGYEVVPVFLPSARLTKTIKEGKYDAYALVNENLGIKNVFLSNEYIKYENIVVSIIDFNIKNINDLKGKSIIAFQNASIYLGKEFESMSKGNKNYKELASQEAQVASLMNGRVDLIILDKKIFQYYLKNSKLFKPSHYILYDIFPSTSYKVAFKDKEIRDDFNEGLKLMKSSGEYEKIIKKYVE